MLRTKSVGLLIIFNTIVIAFKHVRTTLFKSSKIVYVTTMKMAHFVVHPVLSEGLPVIACRIFISRRLSLGSVQLRIEDQLSRNLPIIVQDPSRAMWIVVYGRSVCIEIVSLPAFLLGDFVSPYF